MRVGVNPTYAPGTAVVASGVLTITPNGRPPAVFDLTSASLKTLDDLVAAVDGSGGGLISAELQPGASGDWYADTLDDQSESVPGDPGRVILEGTP